MITVHVHHIWSPYIHISIIIRSSYMITWSSYMIIIHDHHRSWSYMKIVIYMNAVSNAPPGLHLRRLDCLTFWKNRRYTKLCFWRYMKLCFWRYTKLCFGNYRLSQHSSRALSNVYYSADINLWMIRQQSLIALSTIYYSFVNKPILPPSTNYSGFAL
jgi:hypothetical protein